MYEKAPNADPGHEVGAPQMKAPGESEHLEGGVGAMPLSGLSISTELPHEGQGQQLDTLGGVGVSLTVSPYPDPPGSFSTTPPLSPAFDHLPVPERW